MQINAQLSGLANLIALINADNANLNLTEAKVTVGAPVEEAGEEGRNTKVTLTAVAGQGWQGTQNVFLTRLTLGQALLPSFAAAPNVVVAAADDQAAVLTKVVAAAGLVKADVEVTGFVAPKDETAGSLTLAVIRDSYLYVVSEFKFNLTLPAAQDPELSTGVQNSQLSGWKSPQDPVAE